MTRGLQRYHRDNRNCSPFIPQLPHDVATSRRPLSHRAVKDTDIYIPCALEGKEADACADTRSTQRNHWALHVFRGRNTTLHEDVAHVFGRAESARGGAKERSMRDAYGTRDCATRELCDGSDVKKTSCSGRRGPRNSTDRVHVGRHPEWVIDAGDEGIDWSQDRWWRTAFLNHHSTSRFISTQRVVSEERGGMGVQGEKPGQARCEQEVVYPVKDKTIALGGAPAASQLTRCCS